MTKKTRQTAAFGRVLRLFLLLALTIGIAQNAEAAELTSGQKNIIARAYQQTQIEWIPWMDVDGFENNGELSYTFGGGQVYHGIPYGQVPYDGLYVPSEAGFEEFLDAVADQNSSFYTQRATYGSKYSPWYAGDCSSFVSYAYGIGRTTTWGIYQRTFYVNKRDVIYSTPSGRDPWFIYHADIAYRAKGDDGKEIPADWESKVEVGYCVNMPSVHTALITAVNRNADGRLESLEVCENTPPLARCRTLSVKEFVNRFENYELLEFGNQYLVKAPTAYTNRATGTRGVNLTPQKPAEDSNENNSGTDTRDETVTTTVSVSPPAVTVSGTAMTRIYNPWTHEHLHTKDANEVRVLTGQGWVNEGSSWTAPDQSDDPVYRLFNRYTGEHFYTRDARERSVLIAGGWNDEGIGWYSAADTGVPVYRLFNAAAGIGAHHYTTDANERRVLLQRGWADEGIAWYGM